MTLTSTSSIARTLALHGVWGVTPDQFAPASSSPLWTVLLAIVRVLGGDAAWWPFAHQRSGRPCRRLGCGSFSRPPCGRGNRLVALFTPVFVIPLPTLVFIGMEHTLHIVRPRPLRSGCDRLANREPDALWPGGMALAFLTAGLRYEGFSSLPQSSRPLRWAVSADRAWLGLAAALAPCLYAGYAMFHGAPPLPNSVLMKSDPPGSAPGPVPLEFSRLGGCVVPLPASRICRAHRRRAPARCRDGWAARWFVTSCLSCAFRDALGGGDNARVVSGHGLLHVCLVKIEWFFRYEAYVVALGLLAVTLGVAEVLRVVRSRRRAAGWHGAQRAVLACAVVLAIPLVTRAAKGMLVTVPATGEVSAASSLEIGSVLRRVLPERRWRSTTSAR